MTGVQTCALPISLNLTFGADNQVFIESFALFGHLDYEVTEKITLGGGIRYYEADERDQLASTQDFQASIPFTLDRKSVA